MALPPLLAHKHCTPQASSERRGSIGLMTFLAVALSGCAVQSPPISSIEAPQPVAMQKAAQQAVLAAAPAVPTLKRKIALGRISNETSY